MKAPNPLLIALAFGFIYIGWGVGFLFTKRGVMAMPPLAFIGARWVLSGTVLLLISGGWRRWPSRAEWKRAAIGGFLMYTAGNGTAGLAQHWVHSGIAALMLATMPIWLMAIHFILEGRMTHRWMVWPGVFAGISGVAVIVSSGAQTSGTHSPWPYLLLMLSALSWSSGTIYLTRHKKAVVVVRHEIGRQMTVGGAFLILGALLSREPMAWPPPAALQSIGYLIILGIGGMTSYQYLLTHVSPVTVSTFAFVNPLVALAAGALFNGEPVTRQVILAAALIVFSVILILWSGRPEEELGPDA